ncbi:MAG: radical SAM protein [Patescibacteria group bacterium]
MAKLVILTSPLKVMVPIIKVVGDFCNLRCQYCFYNTKDQLTRRMMKDELLEKFLAQYMGLFTGRLIFIWHGGEPLLAGLPFFKKIVDIQAKNLRDGQIIQNTIQTNATLIDNAWAEFFRAHDFRVGVSLDGDKESHDHFRLSHGGGSSFNRVMRGIEILRRHGIEPGIIQTLTHDNVPRAKENFNFFVNILGIKSWGVNDYLDVAGINKAMLGQTIMNEELTQFIKTYIDLWLAQDDSDLRVREIENFISGVSGKRAPNCIFNGSCTGFFCLEYDGRVYPCDRLSNRPELLFGNLSRQSLLEILNGSTRLKYAEDINSLHPDCAVCEWQKACYNGCTIHRVGGTRGKYYYCETRKAVFAYLKEKVEAQKYIPATQTA